MQVHIGQGGGCGGDGFGTRHPSQNSLPVSSTDVRLLCLHHLYHHREDDSAVAVEMIQTTGGVKNNPTVLVRHGVPCAVKRNEIPLTGSLMLPVVSVTTPPGTEQGERG